jgi:hypothetical protein
MYARHIIAVSAVILAVNTLASGSIIDDRSQFVGDYTVIDFEARGDGTPVTEPFYVGPEEYGDLGVSISLGAPPHEFARPFVAGLTHPSFIAA